MAYESRLANKILMTPFDDKSSVLSEIDHVLTPKEFFDSCYVSPELVIPDKAKFRNEPEKKDVEGETSDALTKKVQNDLLNESRTRKNLHTAFFNWLGNFSDTKVYTISGNAGTGKTTLVNSLRFLTETRSISKDKNTRIDWIILDMFRSVNPIRWYGDSKTSISSFSQAYGKAYGILLLTISERLFKTTNNNTGEIRIQPYDRIYGNVRKLIENYKKRFQRDNPAGSVFMEKIDEVTSRRGKIRERIRGMAHFCVEYFSNFETPSTEKFSDALDILILLVRCADGGYAKRYVVVFDNFERFINDDEVYSKEVDDLRKELNSYIKGLDNHKGYFKFIMAIRNSTIRMCRTTMQVGDALPNNLDIGLWYNCDDIIEKKLVWYSRQKVDSELVNDCRLVIQIVGDRRVVDSDGTTTGLKQYIDPLFNYNKRLIIDFISGIVELPSNKDAIDIYRTLWKEDTSLSRFAARSIIRGLILDTLERQDNLFSHIKTHNLQTDRSGNGIARRILTILYDYQRSYENELMPLIDLMSYYYEIDNKIDVKSYWMNMDRDERREFSETLFYMNSYNRRSNDWIQFLDIQIQNQTARVTVSKWSVLERLITDNIDDITLHILPAGICYLTYVVASFEFFSMRYCKHYRPLFTLVPTPTEISAQDVKHLPCYSVIKQTADSAIECMEILRQRKDIPLFLGRFEGRQYHVTRIRNLHKGYLDSFIEYIQWRYISPMESSNPLKKKYEDLCDAIAVLGDRYNSAL